MKATKRDGCNGRLREIRQTTTMPDSFRAASLSSGFLHSEPQHGQNVDVPEGHEKAGFRANDRNDASASLVFDVERYTTTCSLFRQTQQMAVLETEI
jgi:hypothetical protein